MRFMCFPLVVFANTKQRGFVDLLYFSIVYYPCNLLKDFESLLWLNVEELTLVANSKVGERRNEVVDKFFCLVKF